MGRPIICQIVKRLKMKVADGEERDVHLRQEKVDNSIENCYDC